MAAVLIRRGDNLIELSVGGGPLPPDLETTLKATLSYRHLYQLRGPDAYDDVTGAYRPTRTEIKLLYTLDGRGRFVCSLGWIYRLEKDLRRLGHQVEVVCVDSPHPRPDRYAVDWDRVFRHMDLKPKQEEWLSAMESVEHGLIDAPTGAGKAQPLDSLIQTPTGPREMGDIRVGDEVCAVDGSIAHVSGVFPQGEKDIYRVGFQDGSSVECCGDHLWKVGYRTRSQHRGGPVIFRYRVIDTLEMKRKLASPSGRLAFIVEAPSPMLLHARPVPIDPYVLGVMLGDGCFRGRSVTISTADKEIVDRVSMGLPDSLVLRKIPSSKYDHRIASRKRWGRIEYISQLRSLGLWGTKSRDKFVPDIYLHNDLAVRLSVVQGLLDTDGTVAKNGWVSYCTTSEKLAEQFQWLIESLGSICRIRKKTQGSCVSYTCSVSAFQSSDLFRLERKRRRCIQRTKYVNIMRTVASVDQVRRAESRCISVDHPSRLYLTDHCVVTHNTFTLAAYALSHPRARIHFVTEGIDILHRTRNFLVKYIGNVGMVGGGKDQWGQITCLSADSLHKVGEGFDDFTSKRAADVVIFDEVHRAAAPSTLLQLSRYKRARMYGFSGSIEGRSDGAERQLEGLFGEIIFSLSYQEAEALRMVVPIRVEWIRVSGDDPSQGMVNPTMRERHGIWRHDKRNRAIADKVLEFAPDVQVLILVAKLDHAVQLKQYLPEFRLCYAPPSQAKDDRYEGYVSQGLLDRDDEPKMTAMRRDEMRRAFESGQLKKVIATDVWGTGVDFPSLQVVVRADGRASEILDTQLPGRVTRVSGDSKEYGLVIDVLDQWNDTFLRRSNVRKRNYVKKGWTMVGLGGRRLGTRAASSNRG